MKYVAVVIGTGAKDEVAQVFQLHDDGVYRLCDDWQNYPTEPEEAARMAKQLNQEESSR